MDTDDNERTAVTATAEVMSDLSKIALHKGLRSQETQIQFTSRSTIVKDSNKVIFIIGLYPGKQRKKDKNRVVFHGNRSGDLIEEVIKNKENIYLTNLTNYYVQGKMPQQLLDEGIAQLKAEIKASKPRKIICLGNAVMNQVCKFDEAVNIPIVKFPHPSFIIRFNKDKQKYIKSIEKELTYDNEKRKLQN